MFRYDYFMNSSMYLYVLCGLKITKEYSRATIQVLTDFLNFVCSGCSRKPFLKF